MQSRATTTSDLLTIEGVAARLQVSRQAVDAKLKAASVSPSGKVGNALLYAFADLPADLRAQAFASKPYKLPCPVSQLTPACAQELFRNKKGLACTIARLEDPRYTKKELIALGVRDYYAATGVRLSEHQFNRLLDRVIERAPDGDFSRPDIYVPGRLYRVVAASHTTVNFDDLAEVLAPFKGKDLTAADEITFWKHLLDAYHSHVAAGAIPKRVQNKICGWAYSEFSQVSTTAAAFKKTFRRRLKTFVESGEKPSSLAPQYKGRKRGPEVSEEDRDTIITHTVFNSGGRLKQAWRELTCGLVEGMRLSEELLSYYQHGGATVPRKIVDACRPEIDALADIHHGPRQHQLNGAYHTRDWSKVRAGDWWNADDFTFPCYHVVPDGSGWFTLMRGQTIVLTDLRSNRVLAWAMISERNYNALAIRTLMSRCADDHGLPLRGFYFEKGIWERSKLLGGETRGFSMDVTVSGFEDLGLKFVHAKLPRAKPIERAGGIWQNYMEGWLGYCGRNEQIEKFERFQKLKLAIERRDRSPEGLFYSQEEMNAKLLELFTAYNARPQTGKLTGGLSPDEAFQRYRDLNDPPVKFDGSCRHLFSHHQRLVRVGRNGITLQFGKRRFNYKSDWTGNHPNEQAIAWFNSDLPEVLGVTDIDGKNPACIPLCPDVPAMDGADSPEFAQASALIEAHQEPIRTRYNTLAARRPIVHRVNAVDAATRETGAVLTQGAEDAQQLETDLRKVKRRAGRNGEVIPRNVKPKEWLDADAREIEALSKLESQEQVSQSGAKTYILKSAPTVAPPTPRLYWALWCQLKKRGAAESLRHALTGKHLGEHPRVEDMTVDQLGKMIEVFSAILRDKSVL